MTPFHFHKGSRPLLVSMPHVGLDIPDDIKKTMTDAALSLVDTDWYIDRLYDFLRDMDVSIIAAKYSRYVIDLNRGTDGVSLYPGKKVTELCPTTTFDGDPIYQDGHQPDAHTRTEKYWKPYHDKIASELTRLKEIHGKAALWDAHSIKSHVPELFDGRLPDLNLGTGNGTSADHDLVERLDEIIRSSNYTAALNGRFKGGYITRHYGNPKNLINAIQLEISQITYMDEDPPVKFRDDKAERLRPVLKSLLETILE